MHTQCWKAHMPAEDKLKGIFMYYFYVINLKYEFYVTKTLKIITFA